MDDDVTAVRHAIAAAKLDDPPDNAPWSPAQDKPAAVFARWRCYSFGCPDRAPQEHPFPPVCYTCGREMERVQ